MMRKSPHSSALTPTESSVLDLIGKGKTSKEIADLLKMSVLTVGNHRKGIARKLNLHSTAELAAYGALTGLTPQADATCSLNLTVPIDGVAMEITYAGRLRANGGSAKVSIGNSVFRF